eukprot:3474681-Ditylum_brightwellii.AAC.1
MVANRSQVTGLADLRGILGNTSNRKPRAPVWKDGSAKNQEFIALCEQKQWNNLPILGGNADLNDFRRRGLKADDDIEFTRIQLMLKFRRWKNSRVLAAVENEERFIDNNQIKLTPETLSVVSSRSFFRHVIKRKSHETLLKHSHNLEMMEDLRTRSCT